jgi:hypothetical protein
MRSVTPHGHFHLRRHRRFRISPLLKPADTLDTLPLEPAGHDRAKFDATWTRWPVSWIDIPSAANNNPWPVAPHGCGSDAERAIRSKASRCSERITNGRAGSLVWLLQLKDARDH